MYTYNHTVDITNKVVGLFKSIFRITRLQPVNVGTCSH